MFKGFKKEKMLNGDTWPTKSKIFIIKPFTEKKKIADTRFKL